MHIKEFDSIDWDKDQQQPEQDYVVILGFNIDQLMKSERDEYYYWSAFVNGLYYKFKIEIEKGFYNDGQSSPRFSWPWMPPRGRGDIAFFVHDATFRSRGGSIYPIKKGLNKGVHIQVTYWQPYTPTDEVATLSQKACDQLYKAAYIAVAPKEKRKAKFGYAILRIFGRFHFGKRIPGEKRCRKK